VNEENHFIPLINYCHFKSQRHGFVNDFKEWEFSSYHSILKNDQALLASQKVLDWYGGEDAFLKAHELGYKEPGADKFIFETVPAHWP
jgi:hypothetical protein